MSAPESIEPTIVPEPESLEPAAVPCSESAEPATMQGSEALEPTIAPGSGAAKASSPAIRRAWFYAALYLVGALLWSGVYYLFRQEFVVNESVLRVDQRQLRLRGRSLVEQITNAFRDQGIPLVAEEPIEWEVEQRNGVATTEIAYRIPRALGQLAAETRGTLILTEDPQNPDRVLVRPSDAREGTETSSVPFQFRTFSRLVARGYDSPEMSFLGAIYFSMTTITTLGLGDMIPKSDTARFLVVTQVLYGLIMFALFASALGDSSALAERDVAGTELKAPQNLVARARSHFKR